MKDSIKSHPLWNPFHKSEVKRNKSSLRSFEPYQYINKNSISPNITYIKLNLIYSDVLIIYITDISNWNKKDITQENTK